MGVENEKMDVRVCPESAVLAAGGIVKGETVATGRGL